MNMKPMGDLILAKEVKQEKTKSGIILMESADNYVYADVVAVGDGLFTQTGDRIPVTVNVGDRVVIHKNEVGKHKKITINDEEFVLVRESEIALIEIK
jgi:chaperonin GroES